MGGSLRTGSPSIKYRRFGRLDWDVSVLGFGVTRLPRREGDPSRVDEAETTGMLRHAIDHGVNYLDLDYLDDSSQRGQVTRLAGQALGDGYRQKIRIAASLPAALINSGGDVERHLEEQLEWLQTDWLDFFLLGRLNRLNWPELPIEDILRRGEALMADGRIGKLGFSFHDDFQTLRTVLEAYDNWTLARFQYSFMDVDHHPGAAGLKQAADAGLGVVAAEPLKGGRLTARLPEAVTRIWSGASPAEWGLRWVWNHGEVATAVSDTGSLAQLKENIALADNATADSLTVPEELLINRVRDAYRELRPIPCTACRGCMPCPVDIDVPRIFEIYNDAVMYDDIETARQLYRYERHDITRCNACGSCVKACGLGIPILAWLKKAHKRLAGEE